MKMENEANPWDKFKLLAEARNKQALESYIASLEAGEAIRAILRLDADDHEKVLTTLSPAEAADLIEDIPEEQAADIIENLTPTDAATIVAEMQSDEQADLLADLFRSDAQFVQHFADLRNSGHSVYDRSASGC